MNSQFKFIKLEIASYCSDWIYKSNLGIFMYVKGIRLGEIIKTGQNVYNKIRKTGQNITNYIEKTGQKRYC